MECSRARLLLEFARPGAAELDAADIGRLERHLADCPDCGPHARSERRLDDRLAQAMQTVPLPAGSQDRMLTHLAATRRSWWRKRTLQLSVPFVAAAVMGFFALRAPELNPEEIVQQIGSQQNVDEWLQSRNRKFTPPPRFVGKYLVFYELRDFHGVTAPVLEYVKRGTLARVAVLTDAQFRNLKGLPDGAIAEFSSCTLLLVRDPGSPGIVWVVEVINGPVDPFYTDNDPSVT